MPKILDRNSRQHLWSEAKIEAFTFTYATAILNRMDYLKQFTATRTKVRQRAIDVGWAIFRRKSNPLQVYLIHIPPHKINSNLHIIGMTAVLA